ncbi:hypothetical protein Salat_2427400 [Sesamum alatum]|uniref:Uncharacterized protein n=1 Tax=Sesamum alatum TaxID=300844 RepID=A0AAE1XY29_9LAMI|nr:hypothetical protein Salat_2427400 [Sesamum alatum]
MMNRAAVWKFLPEHLPANPFSSSSMRSASATPSEIQSSARGRSPSRTPSVVKPGSTSPSPEVGSSSQKRPHIKDVPQGEETVPPIDPSTSAPPSFPLPVMFPQFNLKAGVSNMCKAVNKGDVESLSGRSMESLGHFLLSQVAMTPAITVAMIKRHDKMRANLEVALSQLKGAREQVEDLKNRVAEGESEF